MKEHARTERIGTELQRELAQVLRAEVRDPRLKLITLQEVRVSRDLAHAKVYFTCFPSDEEGGEQERLLNGRLAGFLRRALARRARLRTMPQLRFIHDQSIAQGEHLSHLIETAVATEDAESGSSEPGAHY
ncbi:30S ribosome-binding factor RbfA [Candidatus Thiosymbion oneisti]|uniref:30S ribosome-binding factor RbfA n=1 Tax=Candidatus Thiosymbion oneisti TaxID=589554 RepID=UPI000A9091A7|nr:30S ribosome-binding factor RbfA [Candidatus Thiosymbion oneisti]